MDTGDGGRFFQENHRFPTSSCSFLRFSRFVDLGFTGWSVHSISVRLIRYKSLVVIEQAGHSVASVVTATNPLSCPLGPAVTCRCGTCVHLPGYCEEWLCPRNSGPTVQDGNFWVTGFRLCLYQIQRVQTHESSPTSRLPPVRLTQWFGALCRHAVDA